MNSVLRKLCMIFCLVISLFTLVFTINAATDKETIPNTTSGGVVTYYKTNNPVYVNTEYQVHDTDFRGVWISPLVSDIGSFTSEKQYKDMMYKVFDTLEKFNINVMVYHVRIMNDAFYPSKYCDRSPYMNTDIDMLPWIIEECHKRGIEFHAWMNPYRVTNNTAQTAEQCAKGFPSYNVACNPSNLLVGQNSIILDPGSPDVRNWLVKVCMEVVENYDVDAIHFDDYFYDNGVDDYATRAMYNTDGLSLDDFRRKQVDMFIESLSTAIRTYNKQTGKRVQLGISPSGVYNAGNGVVTYDANGNAISNGSATASASFKHYGNYLYCDTVKWINNEWIDYILPQTYWACNHPSCPYTDLMEWWGKIVKYKNVKCYSGIGVYQKGGGSGKYGWDDNDLECYYQIMITNQTEGASGVCFFKYSNIEQAVNNDTYLPRVKDIWNYPAIVPEITTMDKIEIDPVENLKISKVESGNVISFDKKEDAKFYVIYRNVTNLTYSADEVLKIIGDLSADGVVNYVDQEAGKFQYNYGVRAMSYSNTLSDGVSVSSKEASQGSDIKLGDMDEIILSEALVENKSLDILFTPIYYPYGGDVKYELTYQFDDGQVNTATNLNTKKGYLSTSLHTPQSFEKMTVKIRAYNSIGNGYYEKEFTKVEVLPNIKNFNFVSTPYAYENNYIVFNNPKIEGATYVLQRSVDNINWTDFKEFTVDSEDTNVTQKIKFDSEIGDYNFRLIVKKGELTGYSNVISLNITNYLGNFNNLTINGSEPLEYYLLEEGENLVIKYKKFNAAQAVTNVISVSTNLSNWMSLSSYSKNAKINDDGTYVTITIPATGSKYELYIKIECMNGSFSTASDIYKFYCAVSFMYSDEILKFFADEVNSCIKETNLFN